MPPPSCDAYVCWPCLGGSERVYKVELGDPDVLLVAVAQRVERADAVEVAELDAQVVPTHVQEEVHSVLQLRRVDHCELKKSDTIHFTYSDTSCKDTQWPKVIATCLATCNSLKCVTTQ